MICMKRIIALLLTSLLSFSLVACNNTELDALQAEIDALKQEKTEPTQITEETADIENIYALNATINGNSTAQISEKTDFEAIAQIPEGMVVDYWTVDGQMQENSSAESFNFTAEKTAIVEPVFRAEKKVTAINAEMRFVDDELKASGDKFTEFVFEKEYTNPVTNEQVTDGTIAVEVKAVIPSGKMVDYWLINGVQYYMGTGLSSFVVVGLDEATTYEVVLKDIPVTYVKLTCTYCNWNGKASASIISGSTITINPNVSNFVGTFVVNGVSMTDGYAKSYTFTITQNTSVVFYATIN